MKEEKVEKLLEFIKSQKNVIPAVIGMIGEYKGYDG